MAAFGQVKTGIDLDGALKTTSATVGVNRTFEPIGYVAPGVARWEDQSSGISIGFPILTLSVRPPSKVSRVHKVVCKVSLPTLETPSGGNELGILAPITKAYECVGIMEFLLPERSTTAERTALMDTCASLFAGTIAASDGAPIDSTATPLRTAIVTYARPY